MNFLRVGIDFSPSDAWAKNMALRSGPGPGVKEGCSLGLGWLPGGGSSPRPVGLQRAGQQFESGLQDSIACWAGVCVCV